MLIVCAVCARQGLEAEKKTLEGDVDRIIHGFNERLSEMCGQRLLLDMELNTAELLVGWLPAVPSACF